MTNKKEGLSQKKLLEKYGDQQAPNFNKVLKKIIIVKKEKEKEDKHSEDSQEKES